LFRRFFPALLGAAVGQTSAVWDVAGREFSSTSTVGETTLGTVAMEDLVCVLLFAEAGSSLILAWNAFTAVMQGVQSFLGQDGAANTNSMALRRLTFYFFIYLCVFSFFPPFARPRLLPVVCEEHTKEQGW
jgi:hypothetical protein